MVVTVKLYAILRLRSKNYNIDGFSLEVDDNCTLQKLLLLLEINPQEVGMVCVNSVLIRELDYVLSNQDIIQIFSDIPMGG